MLKIWGAGTARTLRAYWALEELKLSYERHPIGPRTGETQTPAYTALNIKQKVPVLEDGPLVLTESAAIVSYLGAAYGADSQLVPTEVTARARYDEWVSYVLMELDAHTLYVLRKHEDLIALYGEAPAAARTAREGFEKQIAFAGQRLQSHSTLLDEGFSGADMLLVSIIDWALHYRFELDPIYVAYRDRHQQRPSYARARAANRLAS